MDAKMNPENFFLGPARDYGGIIDYGLTFTKRGCKPYLTITHKEVCHIYDVDLKPFPANNFRTKFLLKFSQNNLRYFI